MTTPKTRLALDTVRSLAVTHALVDGATTSLRTARNDDETVGIFVVPFDCGADWGTDHYVGFLSADELAGLRAEGVAV